MNPKKLIADSHKFSGVDSKIKNFLNAYDRDAFDLSLTALAKACLCSESAISRFVKRAGFSSYKDLTIFMNRSLNQRQNSIELQKFNNEFHFLNLTYSHAINESFDVKNLAMLKSICSLINRAGKIMVFGLGSSYKIASELSSNLQKIGIKIISDPDFHVVYPLIAAFDENDAAIIISNNLVNPEIDFIIKELSERNTKIICITSNKDVRLNRYLTFKLVYSKIHDPSKIIPVGSKISQHLICDYIFELLIKENKVYKQRLIQSANLVQKWIAGFVKK